MILCHTMNDRSKIRPIQFFLPLLSIFFLFYFLYHTFEGDRGVTALIKVNNELSIVQKELSEAKILQTSLERSRERYTQASWLVDSDSLIPSHSVDPDRATLVGQVVYINLS